MIDSALLETVGQEWVINVGQKKQRRKHMYYQDHREGAKVSKELKRFEEEYGESLPKQRIVCPTCNGEGKHVNPSIDSHGITREDFDADPDFMESYMSGIYDVSCYECGGLRVVDIIDEKQAEKEDPELYREWKEWIASSLETEAIYAMERRMGA